MFQSMQQYVENEDPDNFFVDMNLHNNQQEQHNYQQMKQEKPTLSKIQQIHDHLALRVLCQQYEKQLEELANIFKVTYQINEEQGYVEIFSWQDQNNNKRNNMMACQDESEEQIQYFMDQVNELVADIKSKIKELSFDCNYDEYMRMKKVILKNPSYAKIFKNGAQLNLINVDNTYKIQSTNQCLPSLIKKYIIDESISIKICKLDKPEQLNIHFFDYLLLNVSQEGLFIDSFGMDLYHSNNDLKEKIKSSKQNLAFHDSLMIEEMKFNNNQNQKDNLVDIFRINNIKQIQQTPINLCIQTAKDEQSCIYNLKTIIDHIKINKQNNNLKGFFQFGLSLHNSCSDNYLQSLCQMLVNESQKENYFCLPSEYWIIVSEGHEKKILQAMDEITGQGESKAQSCKYAGYFCSSNKNKIKKFSATNQAIISKAFLKGMQYAPIILNQEEIVMDEGNNDLNEMQMNNFVAIETINCDLKKMQLETTPILNIFSPIFEEEGTYSFFDENTLKQHALDAILSEVISDYKKLGIGKFIYEIDISSWMVRSSICKLYFNNDQIQVVGGYGLNMENNNKFFATQQAPQQREGSIEIEEEEIMNKENEEKLKPKLIVRGDLECINIIENLIGDIEQNKYLLYEIPYYSKIPQEISKYFSLLELQHKVWIHIGPHSITIQGYKKTIGRLIPQMFKYLHTIEPKEEKKQVSIELKQNLQLPSTWEQQEGNLKLVSLDLNSNEAQQCSTLFRKTQNNQITSIQRIQNIALMKNYLFEKQKLLEKGNANELLLFHGTRAADPQLIYSSEEEGFDFRLSADNGSYGKGTYFHEMASYSHKFRYTMNGQNFMFLATVLVGAPYASAPYRFTAPPFINGQNGVRYDSVMSNGAQGTNMYMVYHNSKSYPLYLITYR